MKKINIIAVLIIFLASLSMTSCHRETCPAYRSVHTDKAFAYTPDEGKKDPKNNKREVEKKKREQLKRKKYKKPYSLFPGGVR